MKARINRTGCITSWDETPKVWVAIKSGPRRYHLEPGCHYLNDASTTTVTQKYADYRRWSICKVCAGTKEN